MSSVPTVKSKKLPNINFYYLPPKQNSKIEQKTQVVAEKCLQCTKPFTTIKNPNGKISVLKRRDLNGNAVLCNACGLKLSRSRKLPPSVPKKNQTILQHAPSKPTIQIFPIPNLLPSSRQSQSMNLEPKITLPPIKIPTQPSEIILTPIEQLVAPGKGNRRKNIERTCIQCGTNKTSTWRKDEDRKYNCNSCALRKMRKKKQLKNLSF